MPTRFSVPQRDMHRPQILICHRRSIQGCHPAVSDVEFLSCRHPERIASPREQNPVAQLPSPRSEPIESRTRIPRRKEPTPHGVASLSILGPASSWELATSENSDWRAIGNECRAWGTMKNLAQFDTVQPACITFESCHSAHPHSPRHMRNMIFGGASRSLVRIPPIVFGNKLFQTSLSR